MSLPLAALCAQAENLWNKEDIQGAAHIAREILHQAPDNLFALNIMAQVAYKLDKKEVAYSVTERMLQLDQGNAILWANFANLCRELNCGDPLKAAEEAVRLDPNQPFVLDSIGFLLREKGDIERSCACHAKAVALSPNDARLCANYASALMWARDYEAAHTMAQKALTLQPNLPHCHIVMGYLLRETGHPQESLTSFANANLLAGGLYKANMELAQTYFLLREWQKGRPYWEKRLYDRARFAHLPVWQGEKSEHLILHGEQGLGDNIQFLRLAPLVEKRVQKLTLQMPTPLVGLAKASLTHTHITVISKEDPLPEAAHHALLLSTFFETGIFPDMPLAPLTFEVPAQEILKWQTRLQKLSRPIIGFVASGNIKHPNDHNRSLPPIWAETILNAIGHDMPCVGRDATLMLGPENFQFTDMLDTAAFCSVCDLIISVDTATAHLAGTLQKPVWTLLPHDPDWRWGLHEDKHPWYPSMRLFRQTEPGNWQKIVTKILEELKTFKTRDKA